MDKMKNTAEIGSLTAKGGFRNEEDVAKKFNSWKQDSYARAWLFEMGYELKNLTQVKAKVLHGHKTDVQVHIAIYLKNSEVAENISVKLVSNPKGFNQVDKRWVDDYKVMWDIPEDVTDLLKRFTGETSSIQKGLRDSRRMFFSEMNPEEQSKILHFFQTHRAQIVQDILKGRGAYSASWMLVVLKTNSQIKWALKPLRKAIEIFGRGDVKFTERGSLNIGKVTMQRKGGDAGRDTAKMLQFKIDPVNLFED